MKFSYQTGVELYYGGQKIVLLNRFCSLPIWNLNCNGLRLAFD